MVTIKWTHSAVIALLILADLASCGPLQELFCRTRRFKDVPAAINYVHDNLPDNMPLQDKCKRYAVLLFMASGMGVPYESNTHKMLTLDDEALNKRYDAINPKRLERLFMSAIENYRVRRLAPPFLEIVECLRLVDTPESRAYLEGEELNLIIDLYQQMLGSPPKIVDLNTLELSKLRPKLRESLEIIFSDYFEHFGHYTADGMTSAPFNSGYSSQFQTAISAYTEAQQKKQRARELLLYRRRERARLSQQRQRALDPDKARSDSRYRQRLRRERLKQAEAQREHASLINPSQLDYAEPSSSPDLAPDAPKTEREARKRRRQARQQRQDPAERRRLSEQKQINLQAQLEQMKYLSQHHYRENLVENQYQHQAPGPASLVETPFQAPEQQETQQVPSDTAVSPARRFPLFLSIADSQISALAQPSTKAESVTGGSTRDTGDDDSSVAPRQPSPVADPLEPHQQAIDSHPQDQLEQSQSFSTTMRSFGPDSQEELDTYKDMIKSSTDPDGADIRIMQIFSQPDLNKSPSDDRSPFASGSRSQTERHN